MPDERLAQKLGELTGEQGKRPSVWKDAVYSFNHRELVASKDRKWLRVRSSPGKEDVEELLGLSQGYRQGQSCLH